MRLQMNLAIAALVFGAASATSGAVVTVDNDNGVASAGNATFGRQEFTPSIAGTGTNDSVAANSPLPPTVYLETVTFRGRTNTTGGSTGPLFLDIYAGSGDAGTYIGSSSNALTISGAGDNTPLVFSFASLPLDSSTLYSIVASPDAVAGNSGTFRVEASDAVAGTPATSSYAGGTSSGTVNGASLAFDAKFQATFNTVPEPTGIAVIAMAGLGLLARRRRA